MTSFDGLPQQPFVRSFGHGPRSVLAIHCSLAHSGSWRGVAAQLDDDATITAFDMLSHGRSPDWDRKGDIHDRVTEIGASLLKDGMDLVGHSFGATVALRLAVESPQKIRSLTLIEPVFFAALRPDQPELLAALDQAEGAAFAHLFEKGDDVESARAFNRMWGDGKTRWAEMPETARASMVRSIHFVPASRASVYDDSAGLMRPGRLQKVQAPTVLLRGSDTRDEIAEINAALAKRLPNARSVAIDGAGHMVTMTHPEQVASQMRALFSQS